MWLKIAVRWSLVAIFSLTASPVFAQAIEERLPSDTFFFVEYRGLKILTDVRATNGILRTWDDPDFAAMRSHLTARIYEGFSKNTEFTKLPPEEQAELMSIPENPVLLGVRRGEPSASPSNGLFLLVDVSAAPHLAKRLRTSPETFLGSEPGSTLDRFQSGGSNVASRTRGKEASFAAVSGNYLIFTNRRSDIEELIGRMSSPAAPTDSVTSDAAFKEARSRFAENDLIDVFVRISGIEKILPPADEKFDPNAFVHTLHLERVHSVCATVNLGRESTRLSYAILGDTRPGSVFDFFGANAPSFATLAAAPRNSDYQAVRMDLGATYRLTMAAIHASVKTKEASQVDSFDSVSVQMLGMPISEVLSLFDGEFAFIRTGKGAKAMPGFAAATIHRPDDFLQVLRAGLGPMIAAEDQQGDATILDLLASKGKSPSPGATAQFYYVGVTKSMVLAGTSKPDIRAALARLPQGAEAGLGSDPAFLEARKKLPGQISSLSFTSFQNSFWSSALSTMASSGKEKQSASQAEAAAELQRFTEIVQRHLHRLVGGSWKDPSGVFVESSIE